MYRDGVYGSDLSIQAQTSLLVGFSPLKNNFFQMVEQI